MVTCRVAHPMPITLSYLPFVILLCHILRVDGFTGALFSPLIAKRPSPWSAETCAPKATSQGGDSMNPSRIRDETGASPSRIDFLRTMGRMGLIFIFGPSECVLGDDMVGPEKSPTVGKITKDGVKYFDYRVGEGDSPRWGQDCIVQFSMYGRSSPDDKLIKIQSSDDNEETYLFKHGNGRQIKGMEEGLHTMRVGGKRRIIIPQQLGYSVQGLGPYPAQPRKRDKLVKVLQSFEETGRGELVMDIELLEAFDDEADQGYYEDETVSPEDVQAIIAETSRFSEGMPMEKLPGQLAAPMIDE